MNKNKLQSHSNAGRVRSLGLVNMALPLTVATPPQLRHRRHFQFNGMRFEANPLSLQSPRSTLDGDAGDARYSTSSEQRRDSPCFPFKSSASHLHSLRGGDNISVTKTQQHGGGYNTQMHQSSVRMPWRAVNDTDYDNDMAGGEDVYSGGSSIDHMHHAQSSILYCVVNILHLMIKLVRSDVPRTVVDLVQRIAKNYWP
ncbi:hypothetical protein ACLKA7_001848 [Drosophila subpalustris]